MSKSVSKPATLPLPSSLPDELPESPAASGLAPAGMSVYDARPFFEKALVYGVQHGLIDAQKLEAINNDAPKGMVQIARYFGNEFLRPDLEKARERLVNLVSLHLEQSTGGDLREAAHLLRDNSILSRSKAGSDMLKALIAMPVNSHFGMNEHGGFTDDQIPQLARWSLRSYPEYQAELARRSVVEKVIDAAHWLADAVGMDESTLEEAGKDSEAVIRTALLLHTLKRTEMPDWVAFEKLVALLRKKCIAPDALKTPAGAEYCVISMPKSLPVEFKAVVEALRQSVQDDLPKILDSSVSARKLFDQTPAFMGRYFWLEDGLSDVDHFDREASQFWQKATGGNNDDGSLLTLFLCIAAGSAPKTMLTEKGAATLIRKIRKSGLKPELVDEYIHHHAPEQHQQDYPELWEHFMDEALSTLKSDRDNAMNDAMALLRRECHVSG
ncbi:MAG: hypothetical protein Q8K22_09230 [Rhodoferax sp.]|nr:hypothetical protein [Rhodoferax sp.]